MRKLSRLINNILNEEFEKTTNHLILKDLRKISLDYVPENLIHREKELTQLTYLFKDVIAKFNNKEFGSVSLLTVGEKKTGKTTTLKRFGADLEKYVKSKNFESNVSFYYRHINCIRYRTFYSIFISVIQSFVPEFPIRGFSTFELIKYLKEYLEVSNSYLLLTLDDVDALRSDKDYETLLISLITAENDIFQLFKKRISVVLVSTNVKYLDTVNELVSNQLKENVIHFRPYNKNHLFDILQSRAKETLNEGSWTDEDIKTIVEISNMNSSDPRLGLEILWRSAKSAEQKGLEKIQVNDSLEIEELPVSNSKIEFNLKIQEKVILYCLAQIFLKNPNQTFTKIKDIKKEFDNLKTSLNIPFKTLGYTSIFNYLQELKNLNLVVTQVTNNQKRGRTTIIKLNILPSHVEILLHNQLLKEP